MNREEKAAVVDKLATELGDAEAIFAVDYRGISVPQAAALRAKLREADASFRIVKNSLTERAADKAGAETLRELLEGPTALTFVRGDAALAAKAIRDFSRDTGIMEFKGGVMDGDPLTAEEILSIARLPARDVLHTQLVGVVASPVTGLVRGLAALISGLAIQLGQIAEQGLVSGEAPAEAEAPAQAEEATESEQAPEEGSDPSDEEPATEAEEAPAEDAPAEEPATEEPAAEESSTEPENEEDASDGESPEDDDAAEA